MAEITNHNTISFSSAEQMIASLGPQDLALRVLDGIYPELTIALRDQTVVLSGADDAVTQAHRVLEELRSIAAGGTTVDAQLIEATISGVRHQARMAGLAQAQTHAGGVAGLGAGATTSGTRIGVGTEAIISSRGKQIRPKTLNQQDYVRAIDEHTVTFGLGPAGTGKTYLAMAKAVQALQAREVNRIILTRPAVEAGESLGYLPGSLSEKIDPYLRPLYDALHDMVDPENIPHLMAAGTIEVAPLAYMRGRTLNDAFIILDEAQNTSSEQMKMFLTRLGFNSHMVITGDSSQIDLPRGTDSGLAQAVEYLEGIDDIAIVRLSSKDVVRHRLVSQIVDAYETHQPAGASRPARSARNARKSGR